MGKDSWITLLQKTVSTANNIEPEGISIYIFGSARWSHHPNDLDILVVYDRQVHSVESAVQFRQKLHQHVRAQTQIPIDICLLSKEEAEISRFIEMENAERVFPP